MAERSFAREVEDLKLGAGQEFRGEGILAITKALLECGVSYVAGYQGAPISHLMDVLSDAQDILSDLGVHFESSASEATAAATLAASVMYPIRGAVTFKSTGRHSTSRPTRCPILHPAASPAARSSSSAKTTAKAPPSCRSASHAFAMKSQIWLVDPRPNVASIVKAVGTVLRAVRGLEYARDAGGAHSRLPCARPFRHQRQCPPCVRPERRRWKIRSATPTGSCCRRPPMRTRRKRSSTAGRRRSSSFTRAA